MAQVHTSLIKPGHPSRGLDPRAAGLAYGWSLRRAGRLERILRMATRMRAFRVGRGCLAAIEIDPVITGSPRLLFSKFLSVHGLADLHVG